MPNEKSLLKSSFAMPHRTGQLDALKWRYEQKLRVEEKERVRQQKGGRNAKRRKRQKMSRGRRVVN